MSLTADDILPEEPNGAEVIHWMEPGPLRLGSREVPLTSIAAFAAGVAVGAGAILLYHYLAPRREALPPWRWGRGAVH